MSKLKKQAKEVVHCLRVGEVAYAYHLYPLFIDNLISCMIEDKIVSLQPLLNEMLKAQEQRNSVWLADLIENVLLSEFQ